MGQLPVRPEGTAGCQPLQLWSDADPGVGDQQPHPRYDLSFTKDWGPDPFEANSVPIPAGTRIPPGSDGAIAILDPASGKAYGLWQAKHNGADDTWSASWVA